MFRKRTPKTEGYIGAEGLEDWWLSTFTEDERVLMEERYKPFGANPTVTLSKGKTSPSSRGTFHFLTFLAGSFSRKDRVHLGLKMLEKAKEFKGSPIDWHFLYSNFIELRHKQRNDDPQALADVIEACEQMIALAPKVKQAWRDEREAREARVKQIAEGGGLDYQRFEYHGVPPRHRGYEQLIIIRKKQGDKAEAERLAQEFAEMWKD